LIQLGVCFVAAFLAVAIALFRSQRL